MRINTQRHDVDANGMMAQRKFTVDAGAHIMAVLSGLYKNPVDAMVREYLTNMYDAYVALKRVRPDAEIVQPVLHLPTSLDGNLTFRDYGIGMSMETVWNVYATYGASTKNGSNDEVGGFGLGSKTAFCYNGGASWTIESRYNGEKHVFMAFIGEDGVPNLSHVTTMATDEHSGLTISIPIRREDHRATYEAARRYVPYFPMALTVEGDTVPPVEYAIRSTNWGIRKDRANRTHYGRVESRIIMGNVPYPIDMSVINAHPSFDMRDFIYYNGIDLWVNIGDVDIVPSRDDLKYTDRTKQTIKLAVQRMIDDLPKALGKQLDACDTEWAAVTTFNGMNDIRGLHNVMKSLHWRGKVIKVGAVTVNREAFTKLDPGFTVTRYAITDSHRASIEITDNPDVLELSPIKDHTFFIVDDLVKGGATVARAMVYDKLVHKGGNGRTYRYGHTPGHAYLVKSSLPHNVLASMFSGMPASNILLASVLKGVVPITQAAKGTKETIYRWSGSSWDARVNVPTGQTFYYLPLDKDTSTGRYSFVNNRYGSQKDAIATVRKAAMALGVVKSDVVIYGIKSDETKNFDSSWINLVDAMEAEMIKSIKTHARLFALNNMDHGSNIRIAAEVFTAIGVKTVIPEADTVITTFAEIMASRTHPAVVTAHDLKMRIPTIQQTIESSIKSIKLPNLRDALNTVYAKYPMLEIIIGLQEAGGYYRNDQIQLLKKKSSTLLDYINTKR